jgi:putative ABC transport system permease protein
MPIVGVVKDVKHSGLDSDTRPTMYLPYAQRPYGTMTLLVRSAFGSKELFDAVRKEVWAVDKDQPVTDLQSVDQYFSNSVSRRRFNLALLGVFAGVALIMASVGIYGVISYSVTQRTHEIGIRIALGAKASDVLKLVVGQGVILALIGVGIGLAAAVALTRLMSSLLYEVSATDPLTFAAISLLVIGVALGACFVPARRATRVDPMVALRYE